MPATRACSVPHLAQQRRPVRSQQKGAKHVALRRVTVLSGYAEDNQRPVSEVERGSARSKGAGASGARVFFRSSGVTGQRPETLACRLFRAARAEECQQAHAEGGERSAVAQRTAACMLKNCSDARLSPAFILRRLLPPASFCAACPHRRHIRPTPSCRSARHGAPVLRHV